MLASMYESLCSQLEKALKRCFAGEVDGPESDVCSLTEKLIQQLSCDELEGCEHGEAARSSCVSAILQHNLIPLHMECANCHANVCALPLIFEKVIQTSKGNDSFLLPLRDCLLKHDYISFLLSEYLALKKRAGGILLNGSWRPASPICSLVQFMLKIEGAEIWPGQQQQPSGSINRGASTTSRSPLPALLIKKLERFLLELLSLALREVLPTDQAPPGALASFSQGNAGQLLGGYLFNSIMDS
jgi:hypothetical protein